MNYIGKLIAVTTIIATMSVWGIFDVRVITNQFVLYSFDNFKFAEDVQNSIVSRIAFSVH